MNEIRALAKSLSIKQRRLLAMVVEMCKKEGATDKQLAPLYTAMCIELPILQILPKTKIKQLTNQWSKRIKRIQKIELADQDKICMLRPYSDKILKAIGHPEALTTDESMVSDFLDIFDKDERKKQIERAQRKLKIDISPDDYIWEVSERLKKHAKV